MVIEGGDDVNDSTHWATWPLRRSPTRTPRLAFDTDASEEEEEEDELQDSTARSTDEEQTQHTESASEDPSIGEDISKSTTHPNLATQLAEEAALAMNMNPYQSPSKRDFFMSTNEDIQIHPSTLHHPSALHIKIDFPPSSTTAADETPMSRSINDSAIDIGSLFMPSPSQMQGQSLDPAQAQAQGQSFISPAADLGLGFPLQRFRKTFAQQRWRRDMEGLAEQFGRLCVA